MGTFYAGKDSSDGDRPVSERSWPLHRDIPVGGGKFSLCDRCSTCVVRGSDHILEQSRYNVDLVYIQNRDLAKGNTDGALGVTCPNCGAPITNLGAKFCEYCGAGVMELNVHAWSFENIEEA